MSIYPGIQTQIPGDTNIDLFPTPELNDEDYDYDPLPFNFRAPIKLPRDEIPVKNTDLLLTNTLKIFGPITTTKVSKDIVSLKAQNKLASQMLSYIRLYDAQYTGSLSPTSNYSCHLVAAGLKDRYNVTTKRLLRTPFVENDYFGIVAFEIRQRRTLIAFDRNWVLPAIITYIEDDLTYEMEDTVALREKIATYNPVSLDPEDPIAQWDQVPFLKGEKLSLKDLTIYPFQDSAFSTTQGEKSGCYMIFAPVDQDEAEKIYLYLNRNAQLYTNTHQLTVRDVPINQIKDFEYLFPVEIKYIDHYVIISTDQVTRDQLEHIYEIGEVSFLFPALNDLTGAFATYLLSERMYFQYSLRWELNTLYMGLCGYIQALDLRENFGLVLNEIEKENPYYKELPNYETAAAFVKDSDSKCFYHNGKYYAALYSDISIPILESKKNKETSKVELICPLIAINRQNSREAARKYLQDFGYDMNPNPDPYFNDLKLGYRTYEIGGIINTLYYYAATNKDEVDLHEINGVHNEEVRIRLELLLRSGYFFTQKVRNITRGYPDFIPSDPPISRQLTKDPTKLITQLDNLIRGFK